MPLRPLRLPQDLLPTGQMLVQTFQYPENPAWSVQADERAEIMQTVRGLRRFWPAIRVFQTFSPPLRDIISGFVWEEDGRIVATVLLQRRGTTDTWSIGTVGVLPEYRRRGLARRVLEHALRYLRTRGAKRVTLGVIDGNLPAYALYRSLGFAAFGQWIEYEMTPTGAMAAPALPERYVETPLARLDWRPRYDLEQRILPPEISRYEPVSEERFRPPRLGRLFVPLFDAVQSRRRAESLIHEAASGLPVARSMVEIVTRGQGMCTLSVRLDPNHSELAPYLVRQGVRRVTEVHVGRRVEIMVAGWMPALSEAALAVGFAHRKTYDRLGLVLS